MLDLNSYYDIIYHEYPFAVGRNLDYLIDICLLIKTAI
jgi:hypothetical protein